MQKLNTPEPRSTGHGAALLAALARTATIKAASLAKMHDASPAPRLRPLHRGLFDSMFTATTAANVAKAAAPKPAQSLGTKVTPVDTGTVHQHVVASQRFDPDFNSDDGRHIHAAQMRASAGAHAALLAAIRAVHAGGPNLHGSKSPTPL